MQADTIILLMGESGSGKTTIADILEECYNLTQIRSYTTRPRRSESENGHIFIADQQFDTLQHMVSYTVFNGYRYCATADQVQNNNVFVVDPAGVEYFKEHYLGTKLPVVFYISASPDTRYQRMVSRGDTPESAAIRVKHDFSAFKDAEQIADYVIQNDKDDNLQDVVNQILSYLHHNPERSTAAKGA